MAHGVKGVAEIEIGGVQRTLVCDMNAADVLFQQRGEQWQSWLVDHFLGEEVEVEGRKARRLKPLSPGETIETLYALLASDREDSGIAETTASLRRAVGIDGITQVQVKMLHAVLAGFGLPGEFIEAVTRAADEPRSLKVAAGTGTRS